MGRPRKIGGARCPRCGSYANILVGDVLGEHRTDNFYAGPDRRERCVYSGGLFEDARNAVTPEQRQILDDDLDILLDNQSITVDD
jgi:hypothetical protein